MWTWHKILIGRICYSRTHVACDFVYSESVIFNSNTNYEADEFYRAIRLKIFIGFSVSW